MMSGRNAPLSPVSMNGGGEWSGMMSKYQALENDPYAANRGQLISPPNSGGSNGMNGGMMNGNFPPGPRSAGGPSPPPSVGRSSNGTNVYARSESGRSQRDEQNEAVLSEHYVALKAYLRDGSNMAQPQPPNKAKDKLQRLSPVQFLELSTDVYDELVRRQTYSVRGPNNQPPPPFLLAEPNFHPKRNQARQKLSSLGPSRFRDLANDIFTELERRFPRFVNGDMPRGGSPVSVRNSSRSGTPVNGPPPRSASRRRQPSDASSVRGFGQNPSDPYSVNSPPPALPNVDFGRPLPKQFQSNTIVPNKSTMVEEDDDPPPLDNADKNPADRGRKASGATERSLAQSESDRKLIDEYQSQVRDLREKLEAMEDALKKKDDEIDSERSRATATNAEKKQWDDARRNLEDKLRQAEDLNESLKDEIERVRDEHTADIRQLREQLGEARDQVQKQQQQAALAPRGGADDRELSRENKELRLALQEQQAVTDEVRREAQESLREMRLLSQQSNSTWEKQDAQEKAIIQLENEVRDWRNRYARTKTQLRNMRATSLGLTIEQDAARYMREKGFTEDGGLVKDVHVTKFQISIDELVQQARSESPEKVMDAMKAVVVNVRRITKDIDESTADDEETRQRYAKLKAKVSPAANQFITVSKTFASSAGLTPVSLLDAAASHLVAAVVDLLKAVKIRATPAGELDDDDDGTMTPVDSTGFFSQRNTQEGPATTNGVGRNGNFMNAGPQDALPPPPPFQGLNGNRDSADSSAYSPINSPRGSGEAYGRRSMSRTNGGGYAGVNKNLPPAPSAYAVRQPDYRAEDLKIYLEDQTAVLVQTIQNLVGSIRGEASVEQVMGEIGSISEVVTRVIEKTQSSGQSEMVGRLAQCRDRLLDASARGQEIANKGPSADREWRMWMQTLPPIAFEMARQTKDLVQQVDRIVLTSDNDFS